MNTGVFKFAEPFLGLPPGRVLAVADIQLTDVVAVVQEHFKAAISPLQLATSHVVGPERDRLDSSSQRWMLAHFAHPFVPAGQAHVDAWPIAILSESCRAIGRPDRAATESVGIPPTPSRTVCSAYVGRSSSAGYHARFAQRPLKLKKTASAGFKSRTYESADHRVGRGQSPFVAVLDAPNAREAGRFGGERRQS